MGTTWVLSASCGPHVGPVNLAFRELYPWRRGIKDNVSQDARHLMSYHHQALRPLTVVQFRTAWSRHQMEPFSALLALCVGNSPVSVNSPHKGQWRGALMFSLICARINDWVNNCEAGDLRRHRGHYEVNVMELRHFSNTTGCGRYFIRNRYLINWISLFTYQATISRPKNIL